MPCRVAVFKPRKIKAMRVIIMAFALSRITSLTDETAEDCDEDDGRKEGKGGPVPE